MRVTNGDCNSWIALPICSTLQRATTRCCNSFLSDVPSKFLRMMGLKKDAKSGVCDQTSMDARNTKPNPARRFIGSFLWPAHEQPKASPEAPQRDFSVR